MIFFPEKRSFAFLAFPLCFTVAFALSFSALLYTHFRLESFRSALQSVSPRVPPLCFTVTSGGRAHLGGENANNSGQTGPGVTWAVRPRLTFRETWSPGRKKRPRARNTRTERRLVTAANDICPVVLFHLGGSQILGGDMIERPSHLGKLAFAFATPESTYRTETTPRMAEKSAERPR